jgi:hypothetical protein
MKITKSNALQFASNCINRAKSISGMLRNEIELMKKTGYKRDLSTDFSDIDKLQSLARKAIRLLDNSSPGYSFAYKEDFSTTEIETISSSEFAELSDLEINPNAKVDLNDREQLHKEILKVQGKEKLNYLEAFNKVIKKNE